jgi:ankyrin repeat protein
MLKLLFLLNTARHLPTFDQTVYFCEAKFVNMTAEQSGFFDACRRGDLAEAEQMLKANSTLINIEDVKGFTPLIIAVYNNQPAVVDYLLQKGAKLEMHDLSGNTALMGVCFRGYKELAKRLIDAGVDVDQRNHQGATALTFAATFGHLEIAEMLLQKGADINARDVRGKSPLDHAAIQENWEMVKLIESYIQ